MKALSLLATFLAQKTPQGLLGGPPYGSDNPKLRDQVDATGLASRYVARIDIHGDQIHWPIGILVAVCPPTVTPGQSLCVVGYEEDRDAPKVDVAKPGTAMWPPIGVAKIKIADDLIIIPTSGLGELSRAGIKAGEVYVTGTDGNLAKKGDGNYPAAGTQLLAQAVGIAPDRLLLVQIPLQ